MPEVALDLPRLKTIVRLLEEEVEHMPPNYTGVPYAYVSNTTHGLLPVRLALHYPDRGYLTKLLDKNGNVIYTT